MEATTESVYYPSDPFTTNPHTATNLPDLMYLYARDANNQYPCYPDEVPAPPPFNPEPKSIPPSAVYTPAVRTSLHPFADPTNSPVVKGQTESSRNLNPFADTAIAPYSQQSQVSATNSNLDPFADTAEISGRTHAANGSFSQLSAQASATHRPSIDSFYGVM
ncbi:hypothetical protein K435DRAFT_8505 [Dendrothele bispora CBS 962.96]|uniref:Uncharacterized protein n=1 Tax=Dendrothele bispora (strain CBS 962.96) TaxID=1314807 RepID=A0A4S8MYZ0_DENBC|nr:hypothetical protein K435DRAFT_8505 [Dendrothele bispora CBS 962.96]